MRLTFDLYGVWREIDFVRAAPTLTLADLVRSACGLTLSPMEPLWVDDRKYAAYDLLTDVTFLEGSRVTRWGVRPVAPVSGWTATLSGGLRAGATRPVTPGRMLTVGRARTADIVVDSLKVSRFHATVELEGAGVRVRDNGSTNGTLVDGKPIGRGGVLLTDEAVMTVGSATVLVRRRLPESPAPRPGSLHNVTAAGTVPFNRPPRPARPTEPAPVTLPERKDIPPASKFNLITILGPLVLALGMVLLMGNAQYALLAALSPVLGVGTWFEQKRRRTKEVAAEDERYTEALATLRSDLAAAALHERARRQDGAPDPATALRMPSLPSTRLWERRPSAPTYLTLHAGVADIPWEPPVDKTGSAHIDDDVREVLDDARIPAAPVTVDLTDAGVVGIVGPRPDALAVARSLLTQAATHCGPADLTIAVCCDPGREAEWAWSCWLPHTRRLGDATGDRWVSAQRTRSETMLRGMRDGIDQLPTPTVLLVLDTDVLTEGREAPARTLLGQGRPVASSPTPQARDKTQVSGIVLASAVEQLPASCTTVIQVAEHAAGTVTVPDDHNRVDGVILAGIDVPTARWCAMDLSTFDDPELVVPGAALPSLTRLHSLLDFDGGVPTPEAIGRRWAENRGFATPIGVGENGPFSVDLVHDGPHGLVGGTTGSGKSEFLRSLVAGLAASVPPTRLTFILIDFKGGAAFATCERLPHTIGTVSNLDEQLADRALRALEAEMEYRQRVFAAAGEDIDNLDAYLATNPSEPMPRLLLVIDEFAMLAKDYPDVLSALVSVAAVGRTLGVHMILATQRPAGVVNDDILANTNLRVALRVQSRDDSINVIDVPTASAIGRGQQGRAFVKLGQDDITPVQTALSTGTVELGDCAPIDLRPLVFGPPPAGPERRRTSSKETDLDQLIDAIVAANDEAGLAAPRKVWPKALGDRVDLAGFPSADDSQQVVVGRADGNRIAFALADDPDRQRQIPAGWDLNRGNLLLAGIPGSGTDTALASIALAAANAHPPCDLDLIVLDLGAPDLAPLARLPHSVGYVGSGSTAREQQARLLRFLRTELDRRRTTRGPHHRMLVLIDGLAALKDEYQDYEGMALLDGLYRVYADGPDLGMHIAVTTTRPKAVPSAIDEVTTQKWLFQLADRYDYASLGIGPTQIPAVVPGRCVAAETKLQAHIATPASSLDEAVDLVATRWGNPPAKVSAVRQLPESITVAELDAVAHTGGEPWRLPLGIREMDLETAFCDLYEGEHLLVAGPARSGKSTTLLALAEAARAADSPPQVWGICTRRSPLADSDALDRTAVGEDDIPALVASARMHKGPLLMLVDDAEKFDDADQAIAGLIGTAMPQLHVAAAGRSDDLRSMYSHWTKAVRKARCGILLQPDADYDGELLGITVPRRAPVAVTPGRGYACTGGAVALVQCAAPARFPHSANLPTRR